MPLPDRTRRNGSAVASLVASALPVTETGQNGGAPPPIDFDLHGLVGVRLIGASQGDARAVRKQLGPIEAPLDREPDIVIRFVKTLQTRGAVRLLGIEGGFTDDRFLVLRGKHRAPVRVAIPFDRIGQRCEIVCESGLGAVPLLIPILNLTALGRGAVALHASAFTYGDTGVLTTGWSKGGKTEALLAFMQAGARYVGDEWVYLDAGGARMGGIPEPVRVWEWHLRDLPEIRRRLGTLDRARIGMAMLARRMDIATRGWSGSSLPSRMARRVLPILGEQAHVDVPPKRLFESAGPPPSTEFQKVFFLASHEEPTTSIYPVDPRDIARRMAQSLQYERQRLMSHYFMFRFAFPDTRNELIERAPEIERDRLELALGGKETYAVFHPYPVSIPALFEVMEPRILSPVPGSR